MEIYDHYGNNQTAANSAIFSDSREVGPSAYNEFITLYSENQSTAGSYLFYYRVLLMNYSGNYVDSTASFMITVINPCGNTVSMEYDPLEDQEYTIT